MREEKVQGSCLVFSLGTPLLAAWTQAQPEWKAPLEKTLCRFAGALFYNLLLIKINREITT